MELVIVASGDDSIYVEESPARKLDIKNFAKRTLKGKGVDFIQLVDMGEGYFGIDWSLKLPEAKVEEFEEQFGKFDVKIRDPEAFFDTLDYVDKSATKLIKSLLRTIRAKYEIKGHEFVVSESNKAGVVLMIRTEV